MASSGSFNTNTVAVTSSRHWYFEFKWNIKSWSGNTATVSWTVTARCQEGTSRINMGW